MRLSSELWLKIPLKYSGVVRSGNYPDIDKSPYLAIGITIIILLNWDIYGAYPSDSYWLRFVTKLKFYIHM